ncbi:hypothetical protein GCM10027030_09320 [Luteococcus sediminum]
MSTHEHGKDAAPKPMPTAAEWDERYSGERVWSGAPNQSLVARASDLTPGRALDIGCGEGADSVWLATRGWRVTGLDISGKALERTLAAASSVGVRVDPVVAPFHEAELPTAGFDLVSAMYPVLFKGQGTEQRLLSLVAPGGHLLYVHHDFTPREGEHEGQEHGVNEHGVNEHGGMDHSDVIQPDDLAPLLQQTEGWQLLVHERRARQVSSGRGTDHDTDVVLLARRV